jgi:F-type H+-transporting ATPase subunit b
MKHTVKSSGLRSSVLIPFAVCLLLAVLAAAGYANEGGEGAQHVDSAKQMKDFMWRVIDFAALVGIVVWALKKADVKGSLAGRREAIDKALKEATEAKAAAEKKFAEYNEKLAAANKEIDEIYAAIRAEGEAEKIRIIAEAKASAEKIREQAEQAASQEVLKARAELRAEAARLSVQLAEQTIKEKIRKDDQDRLVGEYLTKVVELH